MTLPDQTHIAPSDAPPNAFSFADRLLAEAVSAFESSNPTIDAGSADAAGRSAAGGLEQRVIVRAQAYPARHDLMEAMKHVRSGLVVVILSAIVLALVGGAATARALLGTPRQEPVNFFLVLLGVLGVQSILLMLWLLVMLFGHRAAGTTLAIGSLGGVVVRIGQRLAAAFHRGEHHRAALAACGRVVLAPAMARATFSTISHGLWLAFNIGCLVITIVLLSARQYTFAWETTILSDKAYVPLTKSIAALPSLAGFNGPTGEQIAASQRTGSVESFSQEPVVSQAWSALLVGSIVVYGFAPRLLLLGWSLGQRRVAKQRYRIDVSRPEYLRLEQALMPVSRSIGVMDSDDGTIARHTSIQSAGSRLARQLGAPAILGLEIEPPVPWPPRVERVQWADLGLIETREQQHQVITQLANGSSEPATLVVACALVSTPDRGIGRFLSQLREAVAQPVLLVLTGGQSLRDRSDALAVSQRLHDWHQLADEAGIAPQRVLELDLDHLTPTSAERLSRLVCDEKTTGSPKRARHLEQAFDLIVTFIQHAPATTTAEEHAKLHHSIVSLYRGDQAGWKTLFHLPDSINLKNPGDVADSLKLGAASLTRLLPARLKTSPKWLAAGAAAGALGCIAAAMLISPVAIAALPMWSGIGAAISGVVGASRKGTSQSDELPAQNDRGQVIRSAALLAMVLELQGRDELVITRVLDAAIDSNGDSDFLKTSDGIAPWLDELRHRFDQALARESSSAGAGR